MSKFTPGPWNDFNHSWCETSIVALNFDHAICRLDINHATEDSQESDEAVMVANARLIAAAPDLLEALQQSVGALDLYKAYGWPDRIDVIGKARAAIAKATQ